MAGIVLGSFRYCVNEFAKDEAGKAMFPGLVRLMWTGACGRAKGTCASAVSHSGRRWSNRGRYQGEYEAKLLKRLQGYLDAEPDQPG